MNKSNKSKRIHINIEGYKRKLQLGAGILVLLVVGCFLFYLSAGNAPGDTSQGEIDSNIKEVAAMQKGDAETIDAAYEKTETTEKLTVGKKSKAMYKRLFRKSVFLGDSVTEGLKEYGWIPSKQVCCAIGGSIISADPLVKKAIKQKAEKSFWAFGMNDLIMFRKNPNGFIDEYEKKLAYFHKKSPKTEIYICGISTPSKGAIKKQKSLGKYAEFNKKINKMCKKKGYTYIEVADILANNKKLYEGDGIHAKTGYYVYWLDRMADAAGLT